MNGGDSAYGTGWCHLEAITFYQGFIVIKWLWKIRFQKLATSILVTDVNDKNVGDNDKVQPIPDHHRIK